MEKMPKTNVLTIRIPSDLKHRISLVAENQGVSINQLAMYIFAKEVGNLEASQNLSKFWNELPPKKIYSDFDNVMAKVKNKPVPEWDKI